MTNTSTGALIGSSFKPSCSSSAVASGGPFGSTPGGTAPPGRWASAAAENASGVYVKSMSNRPEKPVRSITGRRGAVAINSANPVMSIPRATILPAPPGRTPQAPDLDRGDFEHLRRDTILGDEPDDRR